MSRQHTFGTKIYDSRLTILWTIYDSRPIILWTIYDSRPTILWTIYGLPENSTQENSTQENSTQNTQHRKLNTRKLNTRKLNTENSTHFKPSIIVIYIIHTYSLLVLLIIYAFDTIFLECLCLDFFYRFVSWFRPM